MEVADIPVSDLSLKVVSVRQAKEMTDNATDHTRVGYNENRLFRVLGCNNIATFLINEINT